EEIDRLRPIQLKSGEVVWRHDLAVQHIINETNWKKPIYFAVTVPQERWERYSEYLEMQGMIRRLVPRKGEFLQSSFLMARNLKDIFEFRGVLTEDGEIDDSVYKSADTRGMFRNFAGAAFQLGQSSYLEGDYADAVYWSELSLKLDPTIFYAKRYLGLYYMRNGEPQKAVDHYVKVLKEEPGNGIYWIMLSSVYEQMGQLPAALYNLQEGSRMAPEERRLFEYGFRIAALLGQRDTARDFVRRWLEAHPDDKQFRKLYDDMDRFLEEEFGIAPEGEGAPAKEEK
ncbi:MAG: tetratricopeptide repeat protein, partial [Candidatus Bathyarchaeota archaeon]|nr:tetratricopeptide repeat protein [Candidatus Bathyarchaeota archaeon]